MPAVSEVYSSTWPIRDCCVSSCEISGAELVLRPWLIFGFVPEIFSVHVWLLLLCLRILLPNGLLALLAAVTAVAVLVILVVLVVLKLAFVVTHLTHFRLQDARRTTHRSCEIWQFLCAKQQQDDDQDQKNLCRADAHESRLSQRHSHRNDVLRKLGESLRIIRLHHTITLKTRLGLFTHGLYKITRADHP